MSNGWRIAATSVVGTSHQKTNAPCQDFHLARVLDVAGRQYLIGLVSDGAGSAPRSDLGSSLACETFAAAIAARLVESKEPLERGCVESWLRTAQTALQEAASGEGRPIRDFACTMLGSVIGPDRSTFFQIGDGAIVISVAGEDDEWCYVFWPQHGEFANTTNFLTDERAVERLEFGSQTGQLSEVAMFSDGMENLLLQRSDRSVFSRWFNQMMPGVRALKSPGLDAALSDKLAAYLASEAVCSRTDDDKTLILATKKGA